MPAGQMGFNLPGVIYFWQSEFIFIHYNWIFQRKWAEIAINDTLEVRPFNFNETQYISKLTVEVDFMQKANTNEPYDSDDMAKELVMQFVKQAFTVGQLVFY